MCTMVVALSQSLLLLNFLSKTNKSKYGFPEEAFPTCGACSLDVDHRISVNLRGRTESTAQGNAYHMAFRDL